MTEQKNQVKQPTNRPINPRERSLQNPPRRMEDPPNNKKRRHHNPPTSDLEILPSVLHELETNRFINKLHVFVALWCEAQEAVLYRPEPFLELTRRVFDKFFLAEIMESKIPLQSKEELEGESENNDLGYRICVKEYESDFGCGKALACAFCSCKGHFRERCAKEWSMESFSCPICRCKTEGWASTLDMAVLEALSVD